MSKADRNEIEEEDGVVVEHTSFGALVLAGAALVGALVLLHYFDLLPI
jgi:hypothetical protein